MYISCGDFYCSLQEAMAKIKYFLIFRLHNSSISSECEIVVVKSVGG